MVDNHSYLSDRCVFLRLYFLLLFCCVRFKENSRRDNLPQVSPRKRDSSRVRMAIVYFHAYVKAKVLLCIFPNPCKAMWVSNTSMRQKAFVSGLHSSDDKCRGKRRGKKRRSNRIRYPQEPQRRSDGSFPRECILRNGHAQRVRVLYKDIGRKEVRAAEEAWVTHWSGCGGGEEMPGGNSTL